VSLASLLLCGSYPKNERGVVPRILKP
jgi:hypothetical protein